jgi:protein-histidine pros-kinase
MGLRLKFNLLLLFAFAVGLVIAGFVSYRLLQDNAREETLKHARIMMESALAIRAYTTQEIRPLLEEARFDRFLPHTVPSYAAQTNFQSLRENFADYTYKEAALNPTNLADLASDWEADIINGFRNDPGREETVTIRETPSGQSLVLSRPLTVDDESCLTCHGEVADAPADMLAIYGSANGFGWELGETIGAQVVSVPMSVPIARAQESFWTFMGALVVIFLFVLAMLNLLLQVTVIRPVVRISRMASQVSLGQMDTPDFTWKGGDEIGSLASSFNRMRRSLENAMKILDE